MHHAHEHRFTDADALTRALADAIAACLRGAIANRGAASLVVSGGRTPVALFNRLAGMELDWQQVSMVPADERWVDVDAPTSNERLVRHELLRDRAAVARFVPLKSAFESAAAGAPLATQRLAELARPFDCVLLGMGDDGHTASLFPGSPALNVALDLTQAPACIAMQAPDPPFERLSLNLAALLDAHRIVLHIQGANKWTVYQTALSAGATSAMPVRAVLRQAWVPSRCTGRPDCATTVLSCHSDWCRATPARKAGARHGAPPADEWRSVPTSPVNTCAPAAAAQARASKLPTAVRCLRRW